MSDNETILHVADLLRDAVRFRHPADGKHVECDFTFPAEWCDLVEKVLRTSAQQPGIDPDLVQRAKELLEWGSTGLLHGGTGGALRAYADRLKDQGIPDSYTLSVAETKTRDEAMAALIKLAALSEGHGGWQPIASAPKYRDLLVWIPFTMCRGGTMNIARLDPDDGGWVDYDDNKISAAYTPTHWMPLPTPPSLPSTDRCGQ